MIVVSKSTITENFKKGYKMMGALEMGGDAVCIWEPLLGRAEAIYLKNNILRFSLLPLETLRPYQGRKVW